MSHLTLTRFFEMKKENVYKFSLAFLTPTTTPSCSLSTHLFVSASFILYFSRTKTGQDIMPSDQCYGETHTSRELTLSNLRALEESLRTKLSEGSMPSIYSVTPTCSSAPSASENKVLLTPSHLSKHPLSTTNPLLQSTPSTPFTSTRTTPFVPYSFPSTEHWKSMTVTKWKAILAQIRWNLNVLIGQEATEELRGKITCNEYWRIEVRHSDAHDAYLGSAQQEEKSGDEDSPIFEPRSTPSSQRQRQPATSSKRSGRERQPWYRRLFPFSATTRIYNAANVPQAHDTEEKEEEPVRFSIRSRKYWQIEAMLYSSHEAKLMISQGYKEFAQTNLPRYATA